MILTLFSSEKKFIHSVRCDWVTRASVGVASFSRINNCPASLRQGLDQVVKHLRWDGHLLLLECLKQLKHICRGVHSASNTSLQLVPSVFGFKSGDIESQGELSNVVVGEEPCGVACCVGFGIVMLKCSAMQRMVREIKLQKNNNKTFFCVCFFLNTIERPFLAVGEAGSTSL